MTGLEVEPIPQLADNYAYLLADPDVGKAAIIDPAEIEPIVRATEARGLRLIAILNTHHHADHTGANRALVERLPGLEVIGSRADAERIPGLTRAVGDGDRIQIGGLQGEALFVPCHTRGHVAYRFGRALFTGDTLFAAGCGRFFEGSAADMHRALIEVIGALPDDTLIYAGHEYTEKNLRFALTVEPDNPAITAKLAEVLELRRQGRPTLPTTLGAERSYNPFLRPSAPGILAALSTAEPGVDPGDPIAVIGALRRLKDRF
jgi:hydroxyacylglutathione hydrolase